EWACGGFRRRHEYWLRPTFQSRHPAFPGQFQRRLREQAGIAERDARLCADSGLVLEDRDMGPRRHGAVFYPDGMALMLVAILAAYIVARQVRTTIRSIADMAIRMGEGHIVAPIETSVIEAN